MGNLKFLTVFIFSILFSAMGFGQELLLNGNFESSTAKWKSYCDAAGVTPVDGVGGGVAGFAISSSTTSPLAGKSSGIITKDAANRQGCGVATDFTVSEENKAQVLQVKIPYKITSGTYADDQYKVYVYDIDNASMIEVAPTFIKNSSIKETYRGVFQTSLTGVNYRLIIHNASTSAVASTFKLEASVSQQVTATGSFATDWVNFTPTGGWSSNTTYTGKYRIVGDTAEYEINVGLTGAPNAATMTVNLFPGHVIDTAKLSSTNTQTVIGIARIQDSGVAVYHANVRYGTTTAVTIINLGSSGTYVNEPSVVDATTPITFGSGDQIGLKFSVPLVGKTSNTVLSSEYESREVSLRATNNSSTTIATSGDTLIPYTIGNGVTYDKVGGLSSSIFTVPSSGRYRITAKIFTASSQSWTNGDVINLFAMIDNSTYHLLGSYLAQATQTVTNQFAIGGSTTIDLVAGQNIRIKANAILSATKATAASLPNYSSFEVERIGNAAVQVAAEQTVGARYKTGAGQSIANASTPVIDFGTKDFDDLGNVTTGGSWKFQPSSAGKFEFCVRVRYANSQVWTATSSYAAAYLYKNGGSYSALGEVFFPATSTPSNSGPTLTGCDVVKMLSTDYVEVRTAHNESSARTLLNSDAHNWVTIKKVGNY